ncbi:NAD-dependent epimerase/dehydratase family protein [Paracoccus sp. (in: a-proteobacteria)]|uniref:NAD-dependent epimerase/dehydratase family protein n=1 Tax=Paracoccus sp. TaxID=267 RepID=UPI0028A96406|nr:NAD-dependent epimerase/dehydratase family protein [Paracoccus sp. (in: a-proteobacteria)]
MKLLQIDGKEPVLVTLFGLGLIGSAVDRALRLRFAAQGREIAYDWHDAALRQTQRAAICEALLDGCRVAVVWTGGQSGFAAGDAEMRQETALLAELIRMAEELRRDRQVDFHLISSAGGLFESQTHCSIESQPRPLRPYGMGKLMQEQALAGAGMLDRRYVYRPSSVYGTTRTKRVGLVTALVSNGLSGRTTRISGNPNTLRDYVLADDIGHYIARQIALPAKAPTTQTLLLARGRSASVFEVIERVRERVERPLLLQFDPHPSNTRDMSFLPSALPRDWQATSLVAGISRVATMARSGIA